MRPISTSRASDTQPVISASHESQQEEMAWFAEEMAWSDWTSQVQGLGPYLSGVHGPEPR